VAKMIRDLQMGDTAITIYENENGHFEARLTSGEHGDLLEIEKLGDGKLRIREMDIGSSTITMEQLAIMLVLTHADDELIEQIKKIKDKQL